jgi:pyruvate kinase
MANTLGKPVFVNADLHSMLESERPLRREVANLCALIKEGVDCIVLEDEITVGKNHALCVQQVAKCCLEAERIIDDQCVFQDLREMTPSSYGTVDSVALQAVNLAMKKFVRAILIHTQRGSLAKAVAKFRPQCRVMACSFDKKCVNQAATLRGVQVA